VQTKARPTKLARALEELGRLIKTLYLLRFIDDKAYRRRILIQLNRGEGRRQLARVVFHGKRGELRQRYREGQEDQLGALGLVVNAIVLWNTIYMNAALDQLRAEGFDVRDEDRVRLSPLLRPHQHAGRIRLYFVEPDCPGRAQAARQSSVCRWRKLKCTFGSAASVMGPWSSSSKCIRSPVSCFCPWSAQDRHFML
jgi:hypothetical protein